MHLTSKGGKRVQIGTTKNTAVHQQKPNSIKKKTLWTQLQPRRAGTKKQDRKQQKQKTGRAPNKRPKNADCYTEAEANMPTPELQPAPQQTATTRTKHLHNSQKATNSPHSQADQRHRNKQSSDSNSTHKTNTRANSTYPNTTSKTTP